MTMIAVLTSPAFAGKLGPAGCGLGNLVFHKDNQVLAATTNGTSYSQLFGITTGTSNCEEGNGVAKLDSFIESNRVALSDDMARGQGDTLAGLGQILNCSDVDSLSSVLKDNYSSVFTDDSVSTNEIGRHVKSVLKSNHVSCTHAG
jgi:hypothetical protein